MLNKNDRVYYNGGYWIVIAVHNDGRMVDLQNVVDDSIIYRVYATDCS